MCRFERSSFFFITVMCLMLELFFVEVFILSTFISYAICAISLLLGWIIAYVILPPDFEYYIRFIDNCIIFEIEKEDHRKINRTFSIVRKTRKHITLSDGEAMICIPYNEKVLKFLKEIKK